MKLITFSGPPSSGKTSVILKFCENLKKQNFKICVIKFDCLSANEEKIFKNKGITIKTGLSGNLCPDHYFVSNIEDCVKWALNNSYDFLITESAGLCSRCSPYIKNIKAICVIDNLMGINAPQKIGPMLKSADIVVITKGDVVSQAEREIFAFKTRQSNPNAIILNINGITGQGSEELTSLLIDEKEIFSLDGKELRVSMPAALCSYCLGETKIDKEFHKGNVKRMNL